MGTIFKRLDNKGPATWQARIRRKNSPKLSRNFSSYEDAQTWVKSVEAELDSNKLAASIHTALHHSNPSYAAHNLTFGFIIERYIAEITAKKQGAAVEVIRLRALQRDVIATYTLAQLSPALIEEWQNKRLAQVSGSTVIKDLATIGHIIETARKEWGAFLPQNPVYMAQKPDINPARDRRLLATEESAILRAAANSRGGYLKNIITFALETAMAQGEIVSLDWQYINLSGRCIQFARTEKGGSRNVPLSPKAMEILEGLQADRNKTGDSRSRVFPQLTTEALKRAFIRACERAGVEDFHFNDLRHEAISRFFEKGLNIAEVAGITGHKTLSVLKRYTHLDVGKPAGKLD